MFQTKTLEYRPDVDGLRAVAIFLVLIFHASSNLLRGGYVGVDVFFVISGYLITRIILNGIANNSFSVLKFYQRRILRIFPALILIIIVVNLLGLLVLLPDELANLGKHSIAASLFSSNFLLYQEVDYFDVTPYAKPLRHMWSLGVEEQFYIIFPMLLVGLSKFRRLSFPFVIFLLIFSFTLNVWLVENLKYSAAYYMPFSRFWELMIGAILAFYEIKKGALHAVKYLKVHFPFHLGPVFYNIVSILGILLIIIPAYFLSEESPFPGYLALAPTFGAALIIYSGIDGQGFRLLRGKFIVSIGKISYPLYLWHWILLSLLFFYSDGAPGRLSRVIIIVLSFLFAILTYQFIEKKFLVKHTPQVLRKLVTSLVVGMILVGSGGYLIYDNKGFDGRFPEKIRPLINFTYDYSGEFRSNDCLLGQEEKTFAKECIEVQNIQKGFPLMMIWGDSHAAQLYSSLFTLHSQFDFALAQFTSSSCPPIINFTKNNRPLCREINDSIVNKIIKLKPKIVLLAHDWVQSVDQNALSELPATVNFLKNNGVEEIILVGPVPHWNNTLQSMLARKYIFSSQKEEIPERVNYGFDTSIKKLDLYVSQIATKLNISYVSSFNTFCNNDGCLVFIKGDKGPILTTYDGAHLTFPGSMFLVSSSIKPLIQAALNRVSETNFVKITKLDQ
jgi:peptidoglycan/LPS O-acetylase OafA/YrhL